VDECTGDVGANQTGAPHRGPRARLRTPKDVELRSSSRGWGGGAWRRESLQPNAAGCKTTPARKFAIRQFLRRQVRIVRRFPGGQMLDRPRRGRGGSLLQSGVERHLAGAGRRLLGDGRRRPGFPGGRRRAGTLDVLPPVSLRVDLPPPPTDGDGEQACLDLANND